MIATQMSVRIRNNFLTIIVKNNDFFFFNFESCEKKMSREPMMYSTYLSIGIGCAAHIESLLTANVGICVPTHRRI